MRYGDVVLLCISPDIDLVPALVIRSVKQLPHVSGTPIEDAEAEEQLDLVYLDQDPPPVKSIDPAAFIKGATAVRPSRFRKLRPLTWVSDYFVGARLSSSPAVPEDVAVNLPALSMVVASYDPSLEISPGGTVKSAIKVITELQSELVKVNSDKEAIQNTAATLLKENDELKAEVGEAGQVLMPTAAEATVDPPAPVATDATFSDAFFSEPQDETAQVAEDVPAAEPAEQPTE